MCHEVYDQEHKTKDGALVRSLLLDDHDTLEKILQSTTTTNRDHCRQRTTTQHW